MNILFLTLSRMEDVSQRDIYSDLVRKFRDEGHRVCVVYPAERRYRQKTAITEQAGICVLRVRTLNLQKTHVLEKGVATLLIEHQFLQAVHTYFKYIRFDLVLYSTPPITFTNVVRTIKKRDAAATYLLLKDIFPQNAVDLGMIKERTLVHRFFRGKESRLYAISDKIGCMSKANVDYLLKNNPELDLEQVEVNPNSIAPVNADPTEKERACIRTHFGLPLDRPVFVYGGNLGKPQGIGFLMEVLAANQKVACFFVIAGNGTEYERIRDWFNINKPCNAVLFSSLSQKEYNRLLQACDVGLIFLDHRFTIPNYPSRLLSYLEYKIPVLAATDLHSDVGTEAEKNGYGFWCESGNLEAFNEKIRLFSTCPELIRTMGSAGYSYLLKHFTVDRSYSTIMQHVYHDV